MPSILLLSIGSRGDAEPIISLASSLLSSSASPFSKVHLCIAEEYSGLLSSVRTPRLEVHTPPSLSLSSMYKTMEKLAEEKSKEPQPPVENATPNDPIPVQLEMLGAIGKYCVAQTVPFLHSLITERDISVVVTTTLGFMAVRSLCLPNNAALRQSPQIFCVHFQPNVYSSFFPCYLSSSANGISAAHTLTDQSFSPEQKDDRLHASHDVLLAFFASSLPQLNQFRRSLLHCDDDIDIEEAKSILSGQSAYVKNVISIIGAPVLQLTAVPDFPKAYSVVPPLADSYIPDDWTPQTKCPIVLDFLRQKEKLRPICVSIGSMRVPAQRRHEILKAILSASFRAYPDRSVILFGGDGGPDGKQALMISDMVADSDGSSNALSEWCQSNVLQVPSGVDVKFAWLFPLCFAVVCHGGAGVVAAALAAGTPPAVAPVMSDQFFWAGVVEKSGVGAFIKPGLNDITEEEAYRAIQVVGDEQVREKVLAYAQARRCSSDPFCTKLVTMLEDATH